MAFEDCIYFNATALARALSGIWQNAYSAIDLTPPSAYVLRQILQKPGLSQQALADELHLERSTMTRALSTLTKKNLIERKRQTSDSRVWTVWPSEEGIALDAQLESIGKELGAKVRCQLSRQKVAQFNTLAKELIGSL